MSIVGLRENLSTIVISYHLVTSLCISYSVIAFSRAYLVTLLAHIWFSPKASGEKETKERNSKKREKLLSKSKKRKNHKLLSIGSL